MDLLTLFALVLVGVALLLAAAYGLFARAWRRSASWVVERRTRRICRILQRHGIATDVVTCKLIDAQKFRVRCRHAEALRAADPSGECRMFCLGCRQRLYTGPDFLPPYTLKDYLADLPPLLPKGSAYRGQLPPKPVIHLFVDDKRDDT